MSTDRRTVLKGVSAVLGASLVGVPAPILAVQPRCLDDLELTQQAMSVYARFKDTYEYEGMNWSWVEEAVCIAEKMRPQTKDSDEEEP